MLGGQQADVLWGSVTDCAPRNISVEGDKLGAVVDGDCKRLRIGELVVAAQMRVIEEGFVS